MCRIIYKPFERHTYTTRCRSQGYCYWDGASRQKDGSKLLTIYCPECEKSLNHKIKLAHDSGLFKVGASNLHRDLPCGCSPRIERIGTKLGIDLFIGESFTLNNNSVITYGEKFRSASGETRRYYTCSVCSLDTELFPNRLHDSSERLHKHKTNCGCNSSPKWTEEQNKVRCKRECNSKGYKFSGFAEDYRGKRTKCIIVCPLHGEYRTCSIDNLLRGRSCPYCAQLLRNVKLGDHNGYYPERVGEKDYLYVLDILVSTKVGRSFDIKDRLRGIKSDAGMLHKPEVLQSYTATHQVIYDTEQAIHKELRERGFQYRCEWTTECFTKDCWYILQEILEDYVSSGVLKRVS